MEQPSDGLRGGRRMGKKGTERCEKERNTGNYLFGREHFVVIFIPFPRKTRRERRNILRRRILAAADRSLGPRLLGRLRKCHGTCIFRISTGSDGYFRLNVNATLRRHTRDKSNVLEFGVAQNIVPMLWRKFRNS